MNRCIRLAISLGDPQGIGAEVTAKALAILLEEDQDVVATIHGPRSVIEGVAGGKDLLRRHENVGRAICRDQPFVAAAPPPSREAGRVALESFAAATEMVMAGEADALVTAPLSKAAVAFERPGFIGHTEWLSQRLGVPTVMALASEKLRVFLVTDHVRLADVPGAVTADRLGFVLRTTVEALRKSFDIPTPRVAVLGLNPHAGENGELGREELDVVVPEMRSCRSLSGCEIEGPFPADSFFTPGRFDRFDGVVAMYHDQGLLPLKLLSFDTAINVTFGLPFPRSSPDHGTAFDLAGRRRADPRSMLEALRFAVREIRARRGESVH